ncbi:TadE/TadG family type IV pilus assembly protein [Bradyrhizobium sp. NP1]|uniref:TadE/TadG family type IV pilus assembly protein n=1 Tax=Bradyrhizobium sp. NP1 TaxID=3049772 RepID=UPI0025A63F05|nr:TadE/TadG family type IV pilus assembly protein [Bradyrhizobium sp. NP1]WJR81244.1 pilus assembly protein [Bradyrhizobium sp. NP1]
MPGNAVVSQFCQRARRFGRDDKGNIAIIFAIAIVPILSFVGAAIDYSRANAARSSMQAALDSTALMLSRDLTQGVITAAQINAKAQAYFNALYTNKDAKGITVSVTYTPQSTGTPATIQVNGSGSIASQFMQMAGYPNINFGTKATTTWGASKLRVALVLDNTGSMASYNKIGALKTAATNLVTQLSGLAQQNGDVYISVVPFEVDVNIGTSNASATWLRWDLFDPTGHCKNSSYSWMSKATCTGHGYSWSAGSNTSHSLWNGCVTDRDQSYDIDATAPSSTVKATQFIADQEGSCPAAQLLPLTYNWSNVNSTINAMSPGGGTNQTVGLQWGWLSLMQQDPLNAPTESSNETFQDIIILFTDGLNTVDRWYGNGSAQSSQVDTRMKSLCDNIKAVIDPTTNKSKFTIYTVQIDTDGAGQSAVLPYCASNPSNFYMLTSSTQIVSAFQQIGTQIAELRVSK